MNHTIIVPVKSLDCAKSRLSTSPTTRRELATAFALDVIAVAIAVVGRDRVVVVAGDELTAVALRPIGCAVLTDAREPGVDPLNAAVELGRAWAADRAPDERVAVVPADLPTITPRVLAEVLAACAVHPSAFCRDADSTGSTIVSAQAPHDLRTAYGPGSAAKHVQLGAEPVTGVDIRARRDVDTVADLREAARLGLGRATAAVMSLESG